MNTGYILHTMMWNHSHIIWTPEYRPEKPEHLWPLLKLTQLTSLHQVSLTKQQVIRAVNCILQYTRKFQSSGIRCCVTVSGFPNILKGPSAFNFLYSSILTMKAQGTFKMPVTTRPTTLHHIPEDLDLRDLT